MFKRALHLRVIETGSATSADKVNKALTFKRALHLRVIETLELEPRLDVDKASFKRALHLRVIETILSFSIAQSSQHV